MTTPTASLDFASGPLNDLGISVTRTPVTITLSNLTGQKTYTDGTPETITVIWNNPKAEYSLENSGDTKITPDGVMYVSYNQTINKSDKITYNSNEYRVYVVESKLIGTDNGFKKVILFLI